MNVVVDKLWIDGTRVLKLRPLKSDPHRITWYAAKVNKIPVGVSFVPARNGWGMFEVEHDVEDARRSL